MALDMTTALTIRAKVDGLGQIENLDRALGNANREASGLSGTFGRLKGATSGIGGALSGLVPAAGIAGLTAMGKRAIDAADNLNDISERTGVAVPILSKFGAAAEDSGSSIEEVAKAMGKLQKGIVDPASKASEALRSIGVSSTDAQGKIRGVDQIMLDIADEMSKMEDPAKKTALAMDLFGKSGGNLIPMLNEGKGALGQYAATIDTEMAQNADKLNDTINAVGRSLQGPFNEALTAVMPLITQMAEAIGGFAKWFMDLPQPVKDLATGFAAVAIPLAAIAIPVAAVVTAFTTLGPAITAIVALLTGPVGIAIAIGALIAVIWNFKDEIGAAFMAAWEGVKSAVTKILDTIGQIGQSLFSIFVQPVIDAFKQLTEWFVDGWMVIFDYVKDPFMKAWDWLNQNFLTPVIELGQKILDWYVSTWVGIFDFIKQPFQQGWEWINQNFIKPLTDFVTKIPQSIADAFKTVTQAITAPFKAAFDTVRGIVNQVLNTIGRAVGSVVQAINNVIAGANQALARVGLPQIPFLPQPNIPQFAEGGVVSGPTLAMVGEGGEPEYIVPQSKAGAFAANWMAGVRGPAAIPRFAEGGMVVPASANVSIQTGPVTQMNGTNFVTTEDLSAAVQAGVNQTLSLLAGDSNVRRSLGLA